MIRTSAFLTLAELDQVHELAPRWSAVHNFVQGLASRRGLGLFYRAPFDVTAKGEFLATTRRPDAKEAA